MLVVTGHDDVRRYLLETPLARCHFVREEDPVQRLPADRRAADILSRYPSAIAVRQGIQNGAIAGSLDEYLSVDIASVMRG